MCDAVVMLIYDSPLENAKFGERGSNSSNHSGLRYYICSTNFMKYHFKGVKVFMKVLILHTFIDSDPAKRLARSLYV